MVLKSGEEGITFTVKCKWVEPTEEELAQTRGRECWTDQEFVDNEGGNYIWVEVTEVVKKPECEDEWWEESPLMNELVLPMICTVGSRFSVIFDEGGAMVDEGDVQGSVVMELEKGESGPIWTSRGASN